MLTAEYARTIARDWNTKDGASGYAGFVTRFELDREFARRYPVQTAGGRAHQELWVPADELEEFNKHIVDGIQVIEAYPGSGFVGTIDPKTNVPVDFLE
ncbi:MAG TPA: ADP-ribosylation/crystallin J1 [Patescibacteria group bacterium]|nr:ADP-ribosylation/crystallin J1 [Patescibacteria group bacterium]